jgi:AraC-like DNA-binding protein
MPDNVQTEREGWSIKDFCAHFGVSRSHVYREFKALKLKRIKIGRRSLIPNESAQAWWQSYQQAG